MDFDSGTRTAALGENQSPKSYNANGVGSSGHSLRTVRKGYRK